MKWNIAIFSMLLSGFVLAGCSEEERYVSVSTEFDTNVEGRMIPIADLCVRTANESIFARIDGVPGNGVDTARISYVNYSEDIESVSYLLPEGATISPVPATPQDSIEVSVNGVVIMIRDLWEKTEEYTITTADGYTYRIAFKLEDFIAQEKVEEPGEETDEPDPGAAGTVFIDLFNSEDPVPDASVWKLCAYASNTWSQYFQHVDGYENVKIEDGYLKLTAKKDNGYYKNGGIRTVGGYPKNTRLEVKAKMDHNVRGAFPAIWQMPIGGLTWPASGEIDLMEWVQSTPNKIYQTFHYNPTGSAAASKGTTITGDVTEWHIYAVERSDEALVFFIDGKETLRYVNEGNDAKKYPFNRYNYDIILNFSLGGNLNGSMTWPGAINDNDLPGELWIDWVRIVELGD